MTIGEVIAALAKYASNHDSILMMESIYSIEVHVYDKYEGNIDIYFVDGNTSDIMINKEGEFIRYLNEE